MTKEFMREDRYIVFKTSDLGNSLKGDEIRRLALEYEEQRRLKGKKPLECVVVEKDWPEYEPTWKAIEARVTGAQPEPSVPDLLESLRCACNYIDKLGGVSQQYRAMLASPEAKP